MGAGGRGRVPGPGKDLDVEREGALGLTDEVRQRQGSEGAKPRDSVLQLAQSYVARLNSNRDSHDAARKYVVKLGSAASASSA